MTARASQQKTATPAPDMPAKPISWAEFEKKYLPLEDGYKYEWVDGQVEKTPRTMDKSQFYIQNNLVNFLYKIKAMQPATGQLIAEGDTFFGLNHRRPDLAYYTEAQILQGAKGKSIVPDFVIEIISRRDQMNLVHKKMQDYRKAKVKVVWHIFPALKEIHVYHGRKMEICQSGDLCSAEPVIQGFKMAVKEVLKK